MKIHFPLWRGNSATPQRKLNFHFISVVVAEVENHLQYNLQ